MKLELAVILILSFIMVYLILIRIFTVLLRITGLTNEKAKFQAISLLTSCGFTTSESEIIANDRARRKIAIFAMITGYAFSVIIVSLTFNLLVNLNQAQTSSTLKVIVIAAAIFIGLLIFFQLPFVKKNNERIIAKIALKIIQRKQYENTITILDSYGKDAICEIMINNLPEIFEDKKLSEIRIRDTYKLNMLMIKRKNKVVDITKNTIVQYHDVIVVFGPYQNIKDLFSINVNSVELVDPEIARKQNVIDIIDNYGTDAMAEIQVNTIPSLLVDKPLIDSGLKKDHSINVLMVKRNSNPIIVNKDTVIQERDVLVVFGPYVEIKDIFI
ncbi:MAG: TrkA C-terminal domain-containing protein [bacterium]|nr:TrkA C-terminal domain-containing protein [bacterium]